MRAALLLSGAAVVAAVDFFKILNISDYAEQDEIKQAYRAMSKIYHPDKFRGDPAEAQEKMVLINEAYRVLSNETLRRMHEYYEEDYEEMVEYEQLLKNSGGRGRRGPGQPTAKHSDPYLYNGDVRILFRQFSALTGKSGRVWVVHLHNAEHCPKEIEEFKRFARLAKRSLDLAAAAINCHVAGQACQVVRQRIQKGFGCKVMMVPAGQFSSDFSDIDWVEYDQEWPKAEEVIRVARKRATSRLVNVDAKFFSRNISTNPIPGAAKTVNGTANATANATDQSKEPLRIWVVWIVNPDGCGDCGEAASTLRKLSNQFKLPRFALLNCKEEKDARLDECKSLRKGSHSLKIYPHRPSKRFVESFSLAESAGEYTAGLTAALRVIEYMVKPIFPIETPWHPSAEATASAAQEVPTGAMEKWTVKQLREFIASQGGKCVGCADKSDFIREAKKLSLRAEM
jgi:curved DNA-binding protein CbpA